MTLAVESWGLGRVCSSGWTSLVCAGSLKSFGFAVSLDLERLRGLGLGDLDLQLERWLWDL